MKPEKVSIIIGACAVLHNIAILRKEPLDGYAEADDQPNLVCFWGPEDGKVIRDHICNTFFWQFLIFVFLPYAISFALNLTSHEI